MTRPSSPTESLTSNLVERLHKRAEIRREIPHRKSVKEGKEDRLANLLDEAGERIAELENALKKFAKAGELFLDHQSEFAASIYYPAAGEEYSLSSDDLLEAYVAYHGDNVDS